MYHNLPTPVQMAGWQIKDQTIIIVTQNCSGVVNVEMNANLCNREIPTSHYTMGDALQKKERRRVKERGRVYFFVCFPVCMYIVCTCVCMHETDTSEY